MTNEYVDDLYVVEGYILGDNTNDTTPTFSIKLEKTNTELIVSIVDKNGVSILAPDDIEVLLSNNKRVVIEEGTSETIISLNTPSKIVSVESANILELELDTNEIIINEKTIKLTEFESDKNKKKVIEVAGGTFDENVKISLNTGENIYIVKGRDKKEIIVPKDDTPIDVQKISGDEIADIIPEKAGSNGEYSTENSRKAITIYFIKDEETPIGELGLSTDDLIVDKKKQGEVFTMVAPSDDLVSFKDIKSSLPLRKREKYVDANGIKKTKVTVVKAFEDIEIEKFDIDKVKKTSRNMKKLEAKHSKDDIENSINLTKVRKAQKRMHVVAKIKDATTHKKSKETNNDLVLKMEKKLQRADALRIKLEKMIARLLKLLKNMKY